MHELLVLIVLLLTILIFILLGKTQPQKVPVITMVPQLTTPQTKINPIYFPRPIYPFPRLAYPIRSFPPTIRPPIRR